MNSPCCNQSLVPETQWPKLCPRCSKWYYEKDLHSEDLNTILKTLNIT